ncbi:MAG: hypothetical protein DWP94_03680 [Flavobacterium sp.]|nr:MAG: hypothetical protein DWP94_03680 [Flavobacterium sp.]
MNELIEEAEKFEKVKLSHMTISDRVTASRKAKQLILSLNEFYKKDKDPELMALMKRLTLKKKKIETRLKVRY